MKKKDFTEIKNKTPEELHKLAVEKEKELATTLIEQKLGKTKNVHLPNKLKKDLAQIKTVLLLKKMTKVEDQK